MTTPSTVADQGTAVGASAPAGGFPLAGRLAAEGLGTFLLVFAGLGIALFNGASSNFPVGIAFGLALVAGLIAFGHISGGHFNPAVTLGSALSGATKWIEALWYVLVQVVSATLATLVLFALLKVFPAITGGNGQLTTQTLFNTLANGYGDHSPNQVPLIGALLIEVVATGIFVAVILGATSARANKALAPVGIGLALAVLLTVTLPLTNGSLNPARSTAVVFFADGWASEQLWLFWVAPLLGAALAGLFFRAFAASTPAAVVAVHLSDAVADADVIDDAAVEATPEETTIVLPQPVPASNDAQDFFDKPEKPRA
ncbi:aquaporin [Arthrobacter sp. 35W]|uniref:aquaporin n=1 Tax=Arthrobacter sp. 35W TaxID=1132441 RepID=UPI000415D142|nr:aquaporin [Arthrobacter sp. 35W]